MAHIFNPSTQEAEADGSLEFEVSLLYRMSSRTARDIQRNPVWGGVLRKPNEAKTINQINVLEPDHPTVSQQVKIKSF